MQYQNKHTENIERCQKVKSIIVTFLSNNNIWCKTTKYPNLILTSGKSLKIVCPCSPNPKVLAVDANKKPADLYVGYICYENSGRFLGFAYHSDLTLYPAAPDDGWENPTNRILIEQLQDLYSLLDVLKSNGGNYV